MKKLLALALMIALSGCTTFVRLSAVLAYPAAAGVETRVGANCIRAQEAGRVASRVPIFDLHQARRGWDAIFRQRVTQAEAEALDGTRDDVDQVCPNPLVTAPLEFSMPQAEPVAPAPQ